MKTHNQYYQDIDINSTALSSLPEDDVPDELIAIVNQMDNVILDVENDDYVPVYDDDEHMDMHELWSYVTYGFECTELKL